MPETTSYAGRRPVGIRMAEESEQRVPDGHGGRFGSGGHAELGEDVRDVGLGRAWANKEPGRDFRV